MVRYYYSGLDEISKKVKEVNYDRLSWNWEGQIQIYSLDEIHLVSFDILNGKVFATEIMEVGVEGGNQSSISASYSCTITWTPGPCESDPTSDGPGVTCHDVFTSTCYYDQPPLLIGYPIWNGSGGFGSSGSSNPGDQYLCDSDPSCIPHPDLMVEGESLIQNYIEGLSDPELRRRAQLDYLRTHGGREFAEFVEELINEGGLSMGDISEINKMVNSVYFNQKGLFMMNIFSPDNVAQVLTLALSNVSFQLRNKIFNYSLQYGAYRNLASLIGNKSFLVDGKILVFKGLTEHGVKRVIERGISEGSIINALNFGSQTIKMGQYGTPHLHIIYNGLEIVIEAGPSSSQLGKIITIMI